jgi:hypothetical protein
MRLAVELKGRGDQVTLKCQEDGSRISILGLLSQSATIRVTLNNRNLSSHNSGRQKFEVKTFARLCSFFSL